ncbi:MAG TPA: FkbM family methyltransferase [Solirubrobacteraceae bacterium]|nr:FkbM family methyltransferase [Solirubrobacteraceae bacterium]
MTVADFCEKLVRRIRLLGLALRGRALPISGPNEWVSPQLEWALEHDSAEYIRRRDDSDAQSMRRLLAFTLGPEANCVDIGAHRGLVLQEMARVAPRGHHVAFEPIPALAAGLRREFPAVEVHEMALSDQSGSARFSHVLGVAEGWSGLKYRELPPEVVVEQEQITVTLSRLDDMLAPDYVPSLIKIDVEGAELGVLRGARNVLSRHLPIIVFEHGSGSAEAYETFPRDIHALLCDELGYRIFDLDGNGPYTLAEFEHGFTARIRVNWVAAPVRR